MIEINQQRIAGFVILQISGRIDSLTAQTVEQYLGNLSESGERTIVIDFTRISYISSAGLRILLLFQKQLKKVDGEIILCNLSPTNTDVFRMSGFVNLFRILNSLDELNTLQVQVEIESATTSITKDRISIEYLTNNAVPGHLTLIGSQEKMADSTYGPNDLQTVKAGDLQFGLGFAALGDDYESTKDLFGEAVIIKGSLFYFPAVRRPIVDYMLISEEDSNIEYKFFFGINITGNFSRIAAFECQEDHIDLSQLAAIITGLSPAKTTGIVLIAESKGLLGMYLKKVPIIENKPGNGQSIYSSENFAEWMDFPVEPTDFNKTVIGCGLAVRNKDDVPDEVARLLPDQSNIHLHAAIFERGPLNKKAVNFQQELKRITSESEASKVIHILDGSRFSSGLIGLIDLEL
jgi:anti-anti-sigma factor